MNTEQNLCNYAILRYLPYREREEFVNEGVLVTCAQPRFWHFVELGLLSKVGSGRATEYLKP